MKSSLLGVLLCSIIICALGGLVQNFRRSKDYEHTFRLMYRLLGAFQRTSLLRAPEYTSFCAFTIWHDIANWSYKNWDRKTIVNTVVCLCVRTIHSLDTAGRPRWATESVIDLSSSSFSCKQCWPIHVCILTMLTHVCEHMRRWKRGGVCPCHL